MTDERDDLDRALASGLADLAPEPPDATNTLDALRPRMRRARTRYRVLQASAIAAVLVVVGVGVALASPGEKGAQVRVVTPPSTVDNRTVAASRATTTTTAAATIPETTPTTNATSPNDNVSVPVTAPTVPPQTVAPNPSTHTYNATGGSVTVRFERVLALVSYTAKPGFTREVHMNKGDDIEVRFRNDDGDESRVRVRVVDGRVVPEIDN